MRQTIIITLLLCFNIVTHAQDKYPITLKSDTLFYVYHGEDVKFIVKYGQKVTQRINELAPTYNPKIDKIWLKENGEVLELMFNEEHLCNITNADAEKNQENLSDYSQNIQEILSKALSDYRFDLTRKQWVKRIVCTILTLLGIILILKLISLTFNRIDQKLSKYERKYLSRKKNLLRYFIPKATKNIFIFISKIIRIIITITILVITVPMLFSFLPWTQGIVEVFYGYLMHPISFIINGLIDFIPHLIFIIIAFIITRYIIRVLKYVADDITQERLVFKGFPKDWAAPTVKLLSVIIYAFAVVMIFPHLPGSDSPAFKGVSIFLGVLFSLGSTSAIANIIAGIVITYMRPYQLGDRVKIVNTEGDVIEKTMLVTRIRTVENIEITIPNSIIISNHLINYSANARENFIIVKTEISIGYDIPWTKVNDMLLQAAHGIDMIETKPEPFVLQRTLEDNYVAYSLQVYTNKVTQMALIKSELLKNILDIFDKEGVEILSPQYIAARDGNASTLPSQVEVPTKHPIRDIIDNITGQNNKSISASENDKPENKE